MFTTEHAPSEMAVAALWTETIDSSRHTGVVIRRASSAWPIEIVFLEGLLDE